MMPLDNGGLSETEDRMLSEDNMYKRVRWCEEEKGRMVEVLLKALKKFQQITVMMHNCQGMIDEIEAVLIDAGFEKEVMAERALRWSYAQED